MRVAPPTITTPLTSVTDRPGVAQRLFDRLHGLGDQGLGDLGKDFGGQRQIDQLAAVERGVDRARP
jgi:hypothetical protein